MIRLCLLYVRVRGRCNSPNYTKYTIDANTLNFFCMYGWGSHEIDLPCGIIRGLAGKMFYRNSWPTKHRLSLQQITTSIIDTPASTRPDIFFFGKRKHNIINLLTHCRLNQIVSRRNNVPGHPSEYCHKLEAPNEVFFLWKMNSVK